MPDFKNVLFTRHSTRDFSNKPIANEDLDFILKAGQIAPSCQNKQPWRFIVVNDYDKIKNIEFKSGILGKVNFFLKSAPIIIIACAHPKKSCKINHQEYYLVDTAIAFQQMMLAAWSKGIGSCWMAAFNEKKIRKLFDIPKKIRIVSLSPFGYPKGKKSIYSKLVSNFAKSKKRKKIKEIVSFNKWNL